MEVSHEAGLPLESSWLLKDPRFAVDHVSVWEAIIGASAAIGIAALARIPALSKDARERADILHDLDLLDRLEGSARDVLRDFIEFRVQVWLSRRQFRPLGISMVIRVALTLVAMVTVGGGAIVLARSGEMSETTVPLTPTMLLAFAVVGAALAIGRSLTYLRKRELAADFAGSMATLLRTSEADRAASRDDT